MECGCQIVKSNVTEVSYCKPIGCNLKETKQGTHLSVPQAIEDDWGWEDQTMGLGDSDSVHLFVSWYLATGPDRTR